jgi:hypothetical protein
MTNEATLAVASLALAVAGGFAFGSPALADEKMPMSSCASDYHSDAQGHCQPDGSMTYGPCQPGFRFQGWPNGNGYRCMPDGY